MTDHCHEKDSEVALPPEVRGLDLCHRRMYMISIQERWRRRLVEWSIGRLAACTWNSYGQGMS